MNNFKKFKDSKYFPVVVTILAVLLAATGIAALLGIFGGSDDRGVSAETTSEATGTLALSDNLIKITALDSDSLGVSPTSTFKLEVDNVSREDEIVKALKIEPEQPFQLKKVSRGEFSILFDKPLEKDRVYRFLVADNNTGAEQSWAFQTKKALNVIRSLPRDKAVQVPVNSGIEITFSAKNIQEPEKYFDITPKTSGRFEQHGNTLVFVPEKLDEATVYTVTMKKGMGIKGSVEALENDYTFRFQTIVPDYSVSKSYFAFSESLYSFTPNAAAVMQVYADQKLIESEVAVDIYSYPDAESFLQQLKNNNKTPSWVISENKDKQYDESKLEKASSLKARIIPYRHGYWETTYLMLPSSLQEGYYLIKAEVEGRIYYTQLQVNPTSVYILAARDRTLAWLNDSATGNPLEGAEVKLDGGSPVKTDKDGLAVMSDALPENGDIQNYYFLIKPPKGLTFVAQVKGRQYQPYYDYYYYNSHVTDNYWTYFYLDKGIYLPEDTVNVWGLIKPRNAGSMEKEAVLELIRYDYSSNGDGNVSVLSSSKVVLSPNGTFTGSIRLKNYNPGSYEARVRIGEKVYLTSYLRILEYTKPAYKLEITPDKSFMFAWEQVSFNIRASFFEGTPVKGLKLDYSCNMGGVTLIDSSTSGTLTSDASGASTISAVPKTNEETWRPLTLFTNVSNREAEEHEINEYSYVSVFPRDTMIEVKSELNDNSARINISTNRIDLGKLKSGSGNYYSEDSYRGASVDMPLTAKLYERHFEAVKTGDYYDYINKVRRDIYDYREVSTLVKEYAFSTANGKYEINYTSEKDKMYYIEVYGKDSRGQSIKETKYLYNWGYYIPYAGNSNYSIGEDNNGKLYKEGENVPVEVMHNTSDSESLAPIEGSSTTAAGMNSDSKNRKYLFIRLKNGLLDYVVSPNPKYEFPFSKELIPNMYVKALCFDGTNIFDAGIRQYSYDSDESKLDIGIKSDKDQYKPGDTVKLTFDVKDAKGKPCSSEVNVSVVDEAFFAISPQYVDTLDSIYRTVVSSGIISNYLSYNAMDSNGNPMAEGGEGGDAYVRKDFRDSALFLTVTSDSRGKAEASFRLPDNLTSWRVTYQAVTEDLKAGSGKLNLSSKLPFFVDTIFNKTFLTGDSPSIMLRANGTQLSPTADVRYTVTLYGENRMPKSWKTTGNGGKLAEIALDALEAGKYTIRIEAESGGLKDAMERSFTVLDSLLETSKTEYVKLGDTTVLSNRAKGLTTVTFYGEDSSLLYSELTELYWSWGQRLDQKLASKIAGEILKDKFGETIFNDDTFDIKNYQTEDGGLAILTYDSSNPALSAKLCSLAADYVDRAALAAYFRKLLGDSKTLPEDIAYAYWGLAALREPVLMDIRTMLEAPVLPPETRLIYGVALAEIGDYQGAREIYESVIKSQGKAKETYMYVENGTRDESIDATALSSLIALRINAPEKILLFNYIRSNSTSELLVNMERLIFVKNQVREASLDCSFIYELDGTKKQINLSKGGYYKLTVTADKLASLKFSNVKGKIIAASGYVAPVSEIRSSADSGVSIQRTYSVEGGKGGNSGFDRSDTIRITITPNFSETAPDGFYEVTDVLPAGFRYVSAFAGAAAQKAWYPDEVTGQKVVFGYYYNKNMSRKESIVYFARAVSPGTFTADNAAIRHTDSSLGSFTGRLQVKVK